MKPALIFLFTIILFQSCKSKNENRLPILGEKEPFEKVVNGEIVIDTIYQTVPPFSYLNQDSVPVTNKDFDGKIYVADFFFTSCNTICPIMHRNMLQAYEKFKDNDQVKFLSHTIDIKYDLPSRLKKYADKLGVKGEQWEFVHGSRDSIFNIAAKSYLTAAYEDAQDPQGLVHQGWFVLVDKQKRIRGAYDGTKEDQVKKMMLDMQTLLYEDKMDEK
ncbi:MAG: SCO family protein [Daejeonella sp.]